MPKEKSEIDDMLADMLPGMEEPPVETPPVEAPPEVPPVEAPLEEPPVVVPPEEPPEVPPVEVPPEEPPPTEPPPEEPPVEETPEERTIRIEEQNRLLLERIEYLSTPEHLRGKPPVEKPPVTPPAVVPPVAPPVEEPPKPIEPVDFIKGRTLEELVDKPEGLNALLNEVISQAGTRNVDVVVEKILRAIPTLVAGQIVQQNTINELVKEFYAANEDLLPAKRTMAVLTNEVHAEHPDWGVKEVFNEAGTRTRKALGLRERAVKPVKRSPAFAKQRGARRGGGEEVTGTQKDIDDLITL